MIIDLEKMLTKRVIYGIIDHDKKTMYVGLTENDLMTRLGQHLGKSKTVKKYIEKVKPKNLEIKVLYEYKRNHKNIRQLLEKKEDYFMKKYSKLGYNLINISKMKKLNLV